MKKELIRGGKLKKSINNWYLILIVGFIFMALGFWPMLIKSNNSYLVSVFFFSISFLIAGFLEIIFAISNTKELEDWFWTLVYGIINSLVGLLLIANLEISILTLPVYVRFTLLFRSIMTVGVFLDLRRSGISGLDNLVAFLGLFFTLILMWNPGFSGLSPVIWRSISLITIGLYSISFSFKVKNICNIVEIAYVD